MKSHRYISLSRGLFGGMACALLAVGCSQQQEAVVSTQATPITSATSKPAQPVRGYSRALHAVPGAGVLSLTADAAKFASVDYGNVSQFEGIRAEKVKISAFGSDGKKVAGPMPLTIDKGEDITVLVTGVPGDIVLLPWKHKNQGPEKGKAKIAFVHAAKALPPMELKIDGKSFRREIKFGIATDYTTLSAGSHQLQVLYDKSLAPQIVEMQQPTVVTKDTDGNVLAVEQPTPIVTAIPRSEIITLTQDVDLEAGKVYSVAVFHDGAQTPKIRLMEDKFVPDVIDAPAAN